MDERSIEEVCFATTYTFVTVKLTISWPITGTEEVYQPSNVLQSASTANAKDCVKHDVYQVHEPTSREESLMSLVGRDKTLLARADLTQPQISNPGVHFRPTS